MKVDIVKGIVYDMTRWPQVVLEINHVEGLLADRQAVIDGIVNILGKTIISSNKRQMKFSFQVDIVVSVSNLFRELAPFVVEFALAMARPDIFEASKKCLEKSKIRFHSREDGDMVHAVAQLIAHIPQGAPIQFEMA
jgi:hypothetical protein